MNTDTSDKVKKYKVSILSESYFLVSDESEEHIKNAAQFVDNCLRQALKKSPDVELKRLAVLIALQLANKTLKLQDVTDSYEHYCDRLNELIDTVEIIDKSHCRI